MRRIATTLSIALLALGLADAGGQRSGITAEAHLVSKGGGDAIAFSGSLHGQAGAKFRAIVVLKSAISNKELDKKECPSQEGTFEGVFGPYDKPLWPQTYVVTVSAAVALSSSGPGKEGYLGTTFGVGPPILDRQILVSVHVQTSVENQREAQAGRFRDALVLLRTLFLEVERQVPSLRKQYATDADKTAKDFDAWWKRWDERQTSLAKSFLDRSYVNYWGNPFVKEYDALANATDMLKKYAVRYVTTISGEEKSDPADRGKDFGQLQVEGKLPSRMLKEQFLFSLAQAFEYLELPNPNQALVEAAATEIAEAFLALRGAYHGEAMNPNGAHMKKYRDFRARVGQLEEELGFFLKGRRNILPGERKIQEQVALMDRFLARMDDLEQKYAAQKEGKHDPEEVQKPEVALELDLVRGTLALAVPQLQAAYDGSWGVYSTMVQTFLGNQKYAATEPPDPEYVKKRLDPQLETSDKLLASARAFLTGVGEGEPGIPPVMDLVKRSEEIGAALRKLVASCEQMESIENDKEKKAAAEAADARAKEIASDLAKLKKQMDDTLPAPK